MLINSLMPEARMTVAHLTRRWTWVVVLLLTLCAGQARGDSFLLAHANVIWSRDNRVYIVSRDSLFLPSLTQLTFRYKQDTIATGEVIAVYDGELISAAITSGSLKKAKRLEKIEVTARPPEFHPPALIRVGYPAPGRKNLLFDCARLEPDTTVLQGAYRPEPLSEGSYRFVRDPSYSVAATWPDTLLVRFFGEVSDEEIALERGDIDVAVFWPGEASSHIREAMGWMQGSVGAREGMYLTATVSRGSFQNEILLDQEKAALQQMNETLFHGDLFPLGGMVLTSEHPAPGRFEVDTSIPGREMIQRFLNAAVQGAPRRDPTAAIRLKLQVVPDDELRSDRSGARYLPRSPILSSSQFRDYVARLDGNALATLFLCAPAGTRP